MAALPEPGSAGGFFLLKGSFSFHSRLGIESKRSFDPICWFFFSWTTFFKWRIILVYNYF